MYWKLEEAVEELKTRQKNEVLVNKVNEFLGSKCPIPQGLNGFLCRHIATARLEDIQFEDRCKASGLSPIVLEHSEDIFVSINPSKKRLVILYLFDGYGKRGGPRIKKVKLVENINAINGYPLTQIRIKNGESLVQFHHKTRKYLGLEGKIIDVSRWLKSIGSAIEYYPFLFAAALTRGVIFESFESPGFPDLERFKQQVVIPAWEFVVKKFGVEPLIVYHPDPNNGEAEENILKWYPSKISKVIDEF
jgi:hypothetical protein